VPANLAKVAAGVTPAELAAVRARLHGATGLPGLLAVIVAVVAARPAPGTMRTKVVAVDGAGGAGKSTFAAHLAAALGDDPVREGLQFAPPGGDDTEIANVHYEEHIDKPFFGELVEFIRARSVVDRLARDDLHEYVSMAAGAFDPDVLTVGFARRVATYKRLDLLLRLWERVRPVVGGRLIDMHLPVQQLYMIAAIPFVLGAIAAAILMPMYAARMQSHGPGR